MKREEAIKVMDRLVELGYRTQLLALPMPPQFALHDHEPVNYNVSIIELGLDKVDVRALVELADELGLEVGYSTMNGGHFGFGESDPTPVVARNPRAHPREVPGK